MLFKRFDVFRCVLRITSPCVFGLVYGLKCFRELPHLELSLKTHLHATEMLDVKLN